ncbi:MAG: zinc-binding dehydrogenase [Lentisphaerae bacterium GWF2_45_14]|nr:MAG: zinc-binding dehydrogenase [Lentisphaerae bacterium GWF2_45_14]
MIMSISESNAIVIERPRQASFRKIKLTPVHENGIICRTIMSAISSGTDMKTWMGLQPAEALYYPLVPGYENAGEVIEGSDGISKGTRVMINECRQFGDICAAWGGNSEYVVKDSFTAPGAFDSVAVIPENLSYKEAVLAYLPCVSLKGIRRIPLEGNEKVLVTGAGMIGISAIQILKILYPEITVISLEPHPFRREIASFYADHVLAPDGSEVKKLMEICGGKLADAVIECSGNASMPGTLHRFIKDGGWNKDDKPAHIHLQGDYPGRIVMDGYNKWFTKNCTITMTCALAPGGKEEILQWMSEGRFDTSRFPVEIWPAGKCAEAYKYKEEKGEEVFKILFDWQE